MAEFLIYNTDHWMDKLTAEDVAKFTEKQLAKYNARYQKGDIVAVYEDGTCIEPPSPDSKFVTVKVPGLSFKDAKCLMEPEINITTVKEETEMPDKSVVQTDRLTKNIIKNRKYKLNISALIPVNKELSVDAKTLPSLTVEKV